MFNNKLHNLSLGIIATSSLLLSACGGESSTNSTNAIDSIAPTVSNVFPNNNHGIHSKKVIVTGQATDETALESVVITYGQNAITAELNDGRFTAVIEATPGENTYTVVATDTAKNEVTLEETFYFGALASAGGAHSGIIHNERIYAWGRNNKGQAGIGAITKISDDPATAEATHPITPTLISAPFDDVDLTETKFVSLAFNQNVSTALDVNGHVWSWGDGDNGQLGLGIADDDIVDDTDYTSPQKIAGLSNIVAISRGYYHCLLLKSDGSVLAFGRNAQGQLGDGTNDNKDTPVAVNGLTNIVQVSAAIGSYALDQEGRLWAWGSNNYAQLANGTTDSDAHNIPTQVAIDEPIVSIASGKGHTLALTESGKVYAWGLNASSQIGMRTSETWDNYILTPLLLPWFDDAIAVWANGNQSFAQRSDGKIYPWGQNMFGTLGIEADDDVEQPNSPILGLENVTDLGNGALHTLAIRNDGSVFSWGWSFEGSLGGGESTIHRWTYRLPLLVSIPES
ncbi:Regulator of chromosome condensation [Oleispira antarctica RB-8]|mgnify:CR=1 FL=1|uniref:Regulator of chromosome condensation n=1 Tax=Oleispira antarctica RB-8 TaxID=698738 RepID=R4YSE2_OLEAN|nr:Regulator of chromosome condensation [Oleispira antarctica RB-8]|tara:strand:- start:1462 stop:2997 length:1536 start_codon:yes stop_codon:yes gene_type:complete